MIAALNKVEVVLYTKKEIDFLRKEIAKEVIRRDRGVCLVCKKSGNDVHEILPRSAFGRSRMDQCLSMENSVLLCRSCHSGAHTRRQRSFLLGLLEETYGYTYESEPFIRYITALEDFEDG